jgi:hypothetical protein
MDEEPTTDRIDALLKWLRAGLPIEIAARLADLSPDMVVAWRQASEDAEVSISKAMAEGEATHLARIAEAGRTNWRAAAWLLEHMYPDKWGPILPLVPEQPHSAVIHNDFPDL